MRVSSDDSDQDDTPRRPTAAELRRHKQTVPRGIPALADPDALPEPVEPDFAWPVEPDRRDAEVLRRAGRDPNVPVSPAEISAIVHKLAERLRDEMGRLLTQVPADIAGQIEKRVEVLEKDFGPHRVFGKWVAGIAATALVAIGYFLYHRGQDEQHVTDELARLGGLVDKLEKKIDSQPTGPRTP